MDSLFSWGVSDELDLIQIKYLPSGTHIEFETYIHFIFRVVRIKPRVSTGLFTDINPRAFRFTAIVESIFGIGIL